MKKNGFFILGMTVLILSLSFAFTACGGSGSPAGGGGGGGEGGGNGYNFTLRVINNHTYSIISVNFMAGFDDIPNANIQAGSQRTLSLNSNSDWVRTPIWFVLENGAEPTEHLTMEAGKTYTITLNPSGVITGDISRD